MTQRHEVRDEFTVDAPPEQVWEAITSGPAVDSWLMGRTEIDSDNKTCSFAMFGQVSTGSITAWEPGHRYAWQEDAAPDGRFTAAEWLIESRDGGGAVVRYVRSELLGEDWEAEYNALSAGHRAYMTKLAVYLTHFAPRTATHSLFLIGPAVADPWAAMTAAFGAGPDPAAGGPARLDVPGVEPVEGTVEYVGPPSVVGMRTDDATYMLMHGHQGVIAATAQFFDGRDPAAETAAWQAWLDALAP